MRHSRWDGLLVALSLIQAALVLTVPSVPLIAIGLWWNANTVSHNFIHAPFFRSRRLNALFSGYLSGLLGFPQRVWRDRHLQHHAGGAVRARVTRWTGAVAAETAIVALCWTAWAAFAPRTFFFVYLPGYAAGLTLCLLQGHYEHARGTTSYYGAAYNVLFFNDGFHVEHHLRPGVHWTRVPSLGRRDPASSRWPPVLRWLESVQRAGLDGLERLVLRSRALQRFVLSRHERAFRALMPALGGVRRVTIVGGGLFPRTALILRRLMPGAALTIVDASAVNLETARALLGAGVELRHESYDARDAADADLLVIPLAFDGDRRRIYERPAAPLALVHDWVWARRSDSALVSWLLLKRLNLVRR